MNRSASFTARAVLALFLLVAAPAAPALAWVAPFSAPPTTEPAAAPPAPEPPAGPPAGPPRRFPGDAPAEPRLGATTGLALLALLSVGALAWWRRRRLPHELAAASIEVVAQSSLGGRARVMWLRTSGPSAPRNLIVTVTPQVVQVIDRWPEPAEPAVTAEPAPVQRARRPSRVRTMQALLAGRSTSGSSAASAASTAARAAKDQPSSPTAPAPRPAPGQPAAAPARPRWDTATHRVIEDRARHLEEAFSGESTFEGIPDDLAADLSADLPLLPDEPGASKAPARSSAELLARAWRRTISRQPPEANNAAARASSVRPPDNMPSVRFSDRSGGPGRATADEPSQPGTSRGSRPPRAARGSIGHATATVRPPAAPPEARRPMVRTELRARRPASARCRLTFRRREEEEPQ